MSKFKKHVFLGICGCIAVLFGLVVQGAQPDTMRQIVWGLKKDFPDCDKNHWAYESVAVLAANGLLKGDETGLVHPDNHITRAEAAKILCEYKNTSAKAYDGVYADVKSTDWFSAYAESADTIFPERYNEAGNRIFSPHENLSRADTVYAVLQLIGAEDELFAAPLYVLDDFTDKQSVPPGMEAYMAVGIDRNLIHGYSDHTLRPNTSVTRAEFCTLLYRCIQPKIYVEVSDDKSVSVSCKIASDKDMRVVLKKRGPNDILDFAKWYLAPNPSRTVLTEIGEKYLVLNAETDTFSPYIVRAVNNINGDMPRSGDFTGGNHSYFNIGYGGSPTGRTADIEIYVDGVSVNGVYQGYATKVDIIFKNRIQANNTKKADGGGREVLEETNSLSFDGIKWKSRINVTALEDIDIRRYYGLQLGVYNLGDTVTYYDEKTVSYPLNQKTWSRTKNCRKFAISGGILDVEVAQNWQDENAIFKNSENFSAFSHRYGKIYFNVIHTNEKNILTAGDSFEINGYYRYTAA